jgi:hypothetical protein
MASSLKKKGYSKVTILDKNTHPDQFGKTFTTTLKETGWIPHEKGTCYLSGSYKRIRDLFKEYVGDDALEVPGGGNDAMGRLMLPAPALDPNAFLEPMDFVQIRDSRRKFLGPMRLGDSLKGFPKMLRSVVSKLYLVGDVIRYRILHEAIFGKYQYHGLPPKPANMKSIDMTFAEFMKQNNLETLLELTVIGAGGYGLGYDVPALYGLMFITPSSVEALLLSKVDKSKSAVQLAKRGFSNLWKAMVAKDSLDLKKGEEVISIQRNLNDMNQQIVLKTKKGATYHADFLIWSAPMTSAFMSVVKDATDFEKDMAAGITSVGLHVNFFKTAKKPPLLLASGETVPEQALTFYPQSSIPGYTAKPNGEVYAERNDVVSYDWENHDKFAHRYDAVYQYYPAPTATSKEAQQAALTFITDSKKTVVPTPSQPAPEWQDGHNWDDYFPHFTQEYVNKLMPWRAFDRQGESRTWYIGSSMSFESTEDVARYNEQLLDAFNI